MFSLNFFSISVWVLAKQVMTCIVAVGSVST